MLRSCSVYVIVAAQNLRSISVNIFNSGDLSHLFYSYQPVGVALVQDLSWNWTVAAHSALMIANIALQPTGRGQRPAHLLQGANLADTGLMIPLRNKSDPIHLSMFHLTSILKRKKKIYCMCNVPLRPDNQLIPTVCATVTTVSLYPPRKQCKHLLAAACLSSSAVTQPVTICRSRSEPSWVGLHLFTSQTPTPGAMQRPPLSDSQLSSSKDSA